MASSNYSGRTIICTLALKRFGEQRAQETGTPGLRRRVSSILQRGHEKRYLRRLRRRATGNTC